MEKPVEPWESAVFRKKSFTLQTFFSGTRRLVRTLPALARAKYAARVSDQLAEKIMLAITAVTDCQYCTRFHTSVARDIGIDESTIADILDRDIRTAVGADERPALLFAQQYAETDEKPGEEAISALVDQYGPEMAADILAFSRAIYWANLLGNSADVIRFSTAHAIEGWKNEIQLNQ